MKQRLARLYVARRLPRRLPARGGVARLAASRPALWCYGKVPRRRRGRRADDRVMPPVH